ncbi:MAG TPA: hypothetical protein DCQ06_01385, partial [Myxococcales bacterium]|nr:hypothetical protein [Myxococcales bacterium]
MRDHGRLSSPCGFGSTARGSNPRTCAQLDVLPCCCRRRRRLSDVESCRRLRGCADVGTAGGTGDDGPRRCRANRRAWCASGLVGMNAAATERLKELAVKCGFSRAGVARAHARPDDERRLRQWLDKGMNGEMQWLARDPSRRSDPTQVVDHAQSVIVLALDYDSGVRRSDDQDLEGRGWISRYALGRDYHKVIEKRLKRFTAAVVDEVLPLLPSNWRTEMQLDGPFDPIREFRWSVDYGPVLER